MLSTSNLGTTKEISISTNSITIFWNVEKQDFCIRGDNEISEISCKLVAELINHDSNIGELLKATPIVVKFTLKNERFSKLEIIQ